MSTNETGQILQATCAAGVIHVDDSVRFKLPTGALKLMKVEGFGRQKSTGKAVFFGHPHPTGGTPWGYLEDIVRVIPRSKDNEADWGDAINNPIPDVRW